MPARRVLILDSTHLEAWNWHGGNFYAEGRFAASDEGLTAFSAYLEDHRSSLFYLLADVVEEAFQFESVPAVQGGDRKAMLERKLAQYFYGSPFTTAVSLGREKSGRRDERLLFAALTRASLLDPWLTALREVEAQLAGIWSPPLLAPPLLSRIAPTLTHGLLLSVSTAGIRQTFVENGKLRFSRLSPQPHAGPADMAAACAAESTRTFQYLVGQRVIARDAVLPTLVLVHPSHSQIFAEYCRGNGELEIVLVDMAETARTIGLKSLPEQASATLLFAQQLMRATPHEQFAPAEERRFFRLWQTRSALVFGGLITLFACLLFAAKQGLNAWTIREQTELTSAQAESDAQRYQALLKTLPQLAISNDDLRLVIDRYDAMDKRRTTPLALYQDISVAVSASPQIEIERIEWQIADTPDGSPELNAQRPSPSGIGIRPGTMPAEPAYAVATVSGRLPLSADADQRSQIETVNAFASELRKNPALRVSVQRMPFDVASERAIRSADTAAKEAPRFAVRVARQLG